MKKKQKPVKIQPQDVEFLTQLCGVQLNFDIDHEKSLVDWRFEKQGRNLSVEMFTILESFDDYKLLFSRLAGSDFIKTVFPSDDAIVDFLKPMRLSRLLFDFMIVECTVVYEDENFQSEFVQYSGFPFTVNGRKHLEDQSHGNTTPSPSEAAPHGSS